MNNPSSAQGRRRQTWSWEQLQGLVRPEILIAPRLDWARVDERCIRYLVKSVAGSPWMDHLALLSAVLTSYVGLDVATVRSHLHILNPRWRSIFAAYSLENMYGWRPTEYIPRYLGDPVFEDTLYTRQRFLKMYISAAAHMQAYIRSIPYPESDAYWRYELQPLPLGLQRQLSRHSELSEAAKRRRKEETDAVTPQFARIRGEAHLRWNELHRLRLKFQEAVTLVESGREALPLAISYEEPERLQRLHFVLWDRPSFVLAHADQYCASTVQHAQARMRSFRPDQNHYFLEFVRIEYLKGALPEPDEFLWFGSLLKNGVMGRALRHGSSEEVKRKQEYLRSWGYGAGNAQSKAEPFTSNAAGLLTWPKAQFRFMAEAQQRAEGLLLTVEPLFAAATFGLAALDLLTTTGARMNELMQVSLTPECLHTLVVEGTRRLVLRMVPKGSDKPAEYFVGPETQRNLEKVARLLQDHYRLRPGEPLPKVRFDPENGRSHRFPARPYLFQYSGRHLSDEAITACLLFLCHGMIFQTLDGRTVALVRLAQAEASLLGPEAAKMRALIQRCDAELAEMALMDAYREDEQHEPELRVEPRS